MAEDSVVNRLRSILKSIDERVEESESAIIGPHLEEGDYDYHVGRKEALDVTRRQIIRLFAEELGVK